MLRDVLRASFRPGIGAAFSLTVAGAACAYEPQGFDAIDGRRRLSELSSSERQLVCDWVDEQASAQPPPAPGASLRCSRARQSFSYLDYGSSCPDSRRTQCPATLQQVRRCIPALLSALAGDPCAHLEISSPDALDELAKSVPSCRNVARCAYHPPTLFEDDPVVIRWR